MDVKDLRPKVLQLIEKVVTVKGSGRSGLNFSQLITIELQR